MEASDTHPAERSWFFQRVSEVAQFTGRLAKNFFKTVMVGPVFSLLAGAVVYFGARGGPVWWMT